MSGGMIITPGRSPRYDVGDGTVVDQERAVQLKKTSAGIGVQLGFDKVTAAVVYFDLAIEILKRNAPPYSDPRKIEDIFQRAMRFHFQMRL